MPGAGRRSSRPSRWWPTAWRCGGGGGGACRRRDAGWPPSGQPASATIPRSWWTSSSPPSGPWPRWADERPDDRGHRDPQPACRARPYAVPAGRAQPRVPRHRGRQRLRRRHPPGGGAAVPRRTGAVAGPEPRCQRPQPGRGRGSDAVRGLQRRRLLVGPGSPGAGGGGLGPPPPTRAAGGPNTGRARGARRPGDGTDGQQPAAAGSGSAGAGGAGVPGLLGGASPEGLHRGRRVQPAAVPVRRGDAARLRPCRGRVAAVLCRRRRRPSPPIGEPPGPASPGQHGVAERRAHRLDAPTGRDCRPFRGRARPSGVTRPGSPGSAARRPGAAAGRAVPSCPAAHRGRAPGSTAPGRHAMTADPGPRTTGGIITHNRREELLGTLRHTTTLPDRAPVVVVDNGSGDGTADAVAAGFPQVTLVRSGANMGSLGRNLAVRDLHSPYVAFSDDDLRWQAGALTRAANLLDAHPGLASVTARILVEPDLHEDPLTPELRHSPVPGPAWLPGPALLSVLAGATML